MTASGQEPAPAPQPRTPYVVTRPAASAPPKPAGAATLDRPSEDHIDEPGYGHGV